MISKESPDMPTNSNNETHRRPSKGQKQKELEKQVNPASAEQGNAASDQGEKTGNRRRKKKRIFPIWLRVIVVLILCVVALLGGLMIGYGIIGDGNPSDALDVETWRHILELMGLQS